MCVRVRRYLEEAVGAVGADAERGQQARLLEDRRADDPERTRRAAGMYTSSNVREKNIFTKSHEFEEQVGKPITCITPRGGTRDADDATALHTSQQDNVGRWGGRGTAGLPWVERVVPCKVRWGRGLTFYSPRPGRPRRTTRHTPAPGRAARRGPSRGAGRWSSIASRRLCGASRSEVEKALSLVLPREVFNAEQKNRRCCYSVSGGAIYRRRDDGSEGAKVGSLTRGLRGALARGLLRLFDCSTIHASAVQYS